MHFGLVRLLVQLAGRPGGELRGAERGGAGHVTGAEVVAEPGVGLGEPGGPQQLLERLRAHRRGLQLHEAGMQRVVGRRVGRVHGQRNGELAGEFVLEPAGRLDHGERELAAALPVEDARLARARVRGHGERVDDRRGEHRRFAGFEQGLHGLSSQSCCLGGFGCIGAHRSAQRKGSRSRSGGPSSRARRAARRRASGPLRCAGLEQGAHVHPAVPAWIPARPGWSPVRRAPCSRARRRGPLPPRPRPSRAARGGGRRRRRCAASRSPDASARAGRRARACRAGRAAAARVRGPRRSAHRVTRPGPARRGPGSRARSARRRAPG